ncbi:MAG TPA: hypothetical protein VFP80_12890 [Thermoanaerobaculia bacterium]|nr:hypothetical protein [Thermoanaerobaculia bacterium]
MARIKVCFVGVCTHISVEGEHRVLLVDARKGDNIRGYSIDAHRPLLRCPSMPEGLTLDGMHITIEGAGPALPDDDTFESCVEHVSEYTTGALWIDDTVLRPAGSPKLAASFACGGRYSGGVYNDAAVAVLEVDTEDRDAVLKITPFTGGAVLKLSLSDGEEVQIENLGSKDAKDRDFDFLLHYRIGTSIPEDAGWPEKRKVTLCKEIKIPHPYDPNTTGPGCANSTYP